RAPARIQLITAQGSWQPAQVPTAGTTSTATGSGTVRLQRLAIDALQARLEATDLTVGLGTAPSAKGQVVLTVPGTAARATGEMAPHPGNGTLQLQASDVGATRRWLTALPLVGTSLDNALQGAGAEGTVRLDAQWRGGWQTALRQIQSAPAGAAAATPAPPRSGSAAFDLQARVATPQLDLQLPPGKDSDGNRGTAVQLRALSAQWAGHLGAATLSLEGEARLPAPQPQQARRLAVLARLSGGLAAPGQWRAQVNALQLQA